jgi:hypothetical protein
MKQVTIILFLLIFSFLSFGQEGKVMRFRVIDGDTVMIAALKDVYIVDYRIFKSEREKRRYTRLVRYVKKVYPYAKLAGEKLRYYDDTLRKMDSEREKKKFMKKIEKEIRDEFEGELRQLTIRQGKILVKLIDRETNHSSYALLQELRGTFSAALWQGVGRVFGYNLKVKYDPEGEDREIEQIVRLIEMGAI